MAIRKAINSFIEFFYFPFLRFMPLQTFKYAVCGGTTVVVSYVVSNFFFYFVLQQDVYELVFHFEKETIAFLVGFLASFPVGFIFNKYIVFIHSSLRGNVQLFRYGLTVLGSLGLDYLFFQLFTKGFEWNFALSRILAIVLVVIYSYFTQQYFSFGKKKIKDIDNV